jgi:hypothetical protein
MRPFSTPGPCYPDKHDMLPVAVRHAEAGRLNEPEGSPMGGVRGQGRRGQLYREDRA